MMGLGISLKRRVQMFASLVVNAVLQRNGDTVAQRDGADVWLRGW